MYWASGLIHALKWCECSNTCAQLLRLADVSIDMFAIVTDWHLSVGYIYLFALKWDLFTVRECVLFTEKTEWMTGNVRHQRCCFPSRTQDAWAIRTKEANKCLLHFFLISHSVLFPPLIFLIRIDVFSGTFRDSSLTCICQLIFCIERKECRRKTVSESHKLIKNITL